MKFHFFFLLVLPVFVFSSGKIQRFSWGEALFKENSVMTLRFVHERDEHISIAETPKQYFYYALAPTEQISISASGYISEKISSSAKIGTYRLQSDSSYSFIESERSEREKFNSLLPSEPSVRITGYEWYRGYYLAKIEIIPLVQSEKNLQTERLTELTVQIKKRMISRAMKSTPEKPLKKNDPQFETILKNLILNYDDAVPYQLEQTTADSTSWFNPALIYLKLHIGRDGIYRLTYAQLQNSFPEILSADPRTIKLFLNGTEVPIYVAGETDGIFDAADYLEFSAERNYTGKQRIITTGNTEYNEYLNRYSDSTVYWLTFSSGNGERLPVNPSAVPTTDALKNYTDFRHLEQNSFIQFAGGDVVLQQSPFYTSQDLWGWGWLNGNSENKQSFSFSDLAATNDSGIVSAKYASWGGTTSSRTHAIALRVGKGSTSGADLRNDTINRYEQFVSSAKFPLSSIQNGTNNVSLFSYPTSSTPVNSVIVDWYELEIPRQLKAISDSLSFRFSYLITTDVRTIQLSNLSTQAVVIYKFASAPKRISNILFSGTGPYTASFVDTVGPGDRYYLTANSKILTPVIVKKKQFTNLRANTSQTDYIIVTHNKFFNETIPLKNYLASARNFSVRLLDIDDIYDEFGFGYPTPEALQRYLQSSTSWQMPLPAYVLLVGDASYDYKFVYKNYNAINYVPSYGYPVSDPLLVTWSSLSQFPQMITGRLPVNNAGEVTAYLNRLQAYSSLGNSDWNKRYMFFTGGDPNTSGQIESFKATNDVVINSYVTPAPIGGSSTHFYKTKNPQSDFGPFSMQEFKNAVSLGSVFISYIGHSGTQTWDNSILDPAQLRNDYNKSPLITDFGCSTGKFAEPQITSFSELFVVGSSSYAVGYIGNSALGFTSIASTLPIEFYKKILRDTVTQIGKAHLTAKIALAQNSFNSTNQVMLYTNELIGEPSVSLDVPFTPNLAVTSSNISAQGILSDDLDSGIVNIVINNFGSVLQDSVNIYIQHRYNNSVIDNSVVKIPFPLFASTIRYSLQTKNASGTHTLIVTIDSLNSIPEITKSDNSAQANITVLSTKYKILFPTSLNINKPLKLILLNPLMANDSVTVVNLEIDTTSAMQNPIHKNTSMKGLTTEFDISSLPSGRRYWWRAKANATTEWVTGTFFTGSNSAFLYGENDSYAFAMNTGKNISISNEMKLDVDTISVRAISAGFTAGATAVIEINGVNVLPNSFSRGFNFVVLDPVSLKLKTTKSYDTYGNTALMDSVASFLNSLSANDIVISVIADAVSTGGVLKLSVQNAFASIGAAKQSVYSYRGSWAVIGKKGLPSGSALESYYPESSTKALAETTYIVNSTNGYFVTPYFGPSPSWSSLHTNAVIPAGASLKTKIIGRKNDASEDTVAVTTDTTFSLSGFGSLYPFIKLRFELTANSLYQSPEILGFSIAGTSAPEFAASAQQNFLNKQIVQEGENINVAFTFFNVGLGASDSVKLFLQTNDSGNDRTLQTYFLSGLAPNDSATVHYLYHSKGFRGNHAFKFIIDADNRNAELYKSNNIITIPYQVLPDTIRPGLTVTVDGLHVLNGDFVREKPEIRVLFSDNIQTALTQQDTSNFKLLLNYEPVYFSGINAPVLVPSSTPGKGEVQWNPLLPKGENTIAVFAKDVSGNYSDTIQFTVNVSSDLEIKKLFNYPNPFSNSTHFTFIIAGAGNPDEAVIKIFTVAGRLIKEIKLYPPQVKVGFNKILWDGSDEDGDKIGNGIYFYKILVKQGEKQISEVQRLVKAG